MIKLTVNGMTFEGSPREVAEAAQLYESAAYPRTGEVTPIYEANPIEAPTIEATPAPAPSVTALYPLTTALKSAVRKDMTRKAPNTNIVMTRLKHERHLRKWTGEYMGSFIKVCATTYGRIENGDKTANQERVYALAAALGMNNQQGVKELFDHLGRARLYQPQEGSK